MRLCDRIGNNDEVQRCLHRLELSNDQGIIQQHEKNIISDMKMKVAREKAQFVTYRNAARDILRSSKKITDRHQEPNAKLQYLSSFQMEIPHNLGIRLPIKYRRVLLMILVMVGYRKLCVEFSLLPSCIKDKNIVTIQECRVRELAIYVNLALSTKSKAFKRIVFSKVKKLHDEAYRSGNYITVIGTDRYLYRLAKDRELQDEVERTSEQWRDEGERLSELVNELSILSIIERQ